jgi:hypothetical protein
LPTQIWPSLPGRTLIGRTLTGGTRRHASGHGRGRHDWGRAGPSRRSRYALRGGGRRRNGSYWLAWDGRPGCRGLGYRRRRPLRSGRRFILSLLNRLQHVARFRYSRPIDLLLGLALCFRRAGAVLAAAVKVLTYALRFIRFQRTRVRLLLRDTDMRQGVKDRPAFYFQLAC